MSTYDRYRQALDGEPLPCAFVDLDAVDQNLETLLQPVRETGKTLRMASKSLRCVPLMRHLFAQGGDVLQGVMCFSAAEAAWLADQGFKDLFVAYPTGQAADAQVLAQANLGEATVGIEKIKGDLGTLWERLASEQENDTSDPAEPGEPDTRNEGDES